MINTFLHSIKKQSASSPVSLKPFFILFLIIGTLIGSPTGCTTIPTPPSPLAVSVSRVEQAVQTIREAYEQKDETKLLGQIDPSFPNLATLKTQIKNDFQFRSIKMEMRISRVDVTEEAIAAGVYWEGEWINKEPLRQAGYAVFRFNKEASPKLLEIRGDIPWGFHE